ncbi:MAG: heat-inducible transcription repressor HrcA [Pseudomonadales bacterium]|nr:heat-inducible transcription repressor HrcA [Pseudomonadales bacterium]
MIHRTSDEPLDSRAQQLLKLVVEHYLQDGRPVASKALAELPEMGVSSATVRNILADLEHLGLVRSPHTSAGKVPTVQGLRLFVDTMLAVEPLDTRRVHEVQQQLDPELSPRELVSNASEMLTRLTRMTCVVTTPQRQGVPLKHLEFVKLTDTRLLVVLVMQDREVQNRVIQTERAYSDEELTSASNFLNREYAGRSLEDIRADLLRSMRRDKDRMDKLMETALDVASRTFDSEVATPGRDVVVAGETRLLNVTGDLSIVRTLFDTFSQKNVILHLLDRCLETDGIQLFIGQETGYAELDEVSLVTRRYAVDGTVAGVLGVIGPTRMAYREIIPVVDVTARLLGAALRYG